MRLRGVQEAEHKFAYEQGKMVEMQKQLDALAQSGRDEKERRVVADTAVALAQKQLAAAQQTFVLELAASKQLTSQAAQQKELSEKQLNEASAQLKSVNQELQAAKMRELEVLREVLLLLLAVAITRHCRFSKQIATTRLN